ncbi:MAG: restriction endonuclease subunit S [Acidobacteriota bacterium]
MKKGWQITTLGEACEVVNGGTPRTGVPEYWDGSHLWITPAEMGKRVSPYVSDTARKISDLGLRKSSARMLPPNSVILSSRAPIGHLVINTEPMATNQGCKGLIPGSQLQHKYLYFYLSSIVDLLNSLGTGATFNELSGGKLKEVRIPVPPLPDQQRIVVILDEAFERIATAKANAERNLQNARALFDAVLSSACSGELTEKWRNSHPDAEPGSELFSRIVRARRQRWEQQQLAAYESKGIQPPKDWREKYQSPAAPDKRNLPVLPKSWAALSVSEATHRLTYGITVRPKYVDDGIPIISGREIRSGEVDLEIANRISQHDYNGLREKCKLQLNDVLFGKTGTIGTVARVKVRAPLCVSQNVAVLSPIIRADYFELVMRSRIIKQMAMASIIIAAIPDLQLRFIETFPIPLPPEEEQNAIVKKVHAFRDETQRLASLYERKLAALEALKKSLLHQAFTGQL